MCNKEIKFKAFLDHAIDLGADYIATGHYARAGHENNLHTLVKGKDHNKDQTYFLYTLGQKQLEKTLFPIGEIEKPEVRKLAEQAGFKVHDKQDSTGICFIGERNFKEFLERYLPEQPGEMRTPEGELVGEHQGLMFYTIGQRQGLGIGGRKDASELPWYTIDKDLENNILLVAQGHDHPLLYKNDLEAIDLHWVSGSPPTAPFICMAKTRYRQKDQVCTIKRLEDNSCSVIFDRPQRAITPGQSIVFYTGDICLGGGIIS
jgi:tRNA-specific 2-thiouridylase